MIHTESCFQNSSLNKTLEVDKDGLFQIDVIIWVTIPLLLIGNVFLSWLVHFEWYGGDPQKRSVNNRLISSFLICIMICNVAKCALLIVFRYNLLGIPMAGILLSVITWFATTAVILFTASNIIRFLQVVIWKHVVEFNEEVVVRATLRSCHFMFTAHASYRREVLDWKDLFEELSDGHEFFCFEDYYRIQSM